MKLVFGSETSYFTKYRPFFIFLNDLENPAHDFRFRLCFKSENFGSHTVYFKILKLLNFDYIYQLFWTRIITDR